MEPKPHEIARWFRQKAAEFNAIADNLEQTFKPGGAPLPAAAVASVPPRTTVSFEAVRHFLLTRRAARLQQIADNLGCDLELVRRIVEAHPNELRYSKRGLVKLKPAPAQSSSASVARLRQAACLRA